MLLHFHNVVLFCLFCFIKIQKSGVLKKAIDHIKHLRNTNTRLRRENMSFKMKLQQLGKKNTVQYYINYYNLCCE